MDDLFKLKPEKFSWTTEGSRVIIKYDGVRVMSLFIGEVMESVGRPFCVGHIKECDNSPWLDEWHKSRYDELIEVLNTDYTDE